MEKKSTLMDFLTVREKPREDQDISPHLERGPPETTECHCILSNWG